MFEPISPADFDLDIGEILLVHRNSHIHNFRYTAYRNGRSMDGLVLCLSGKAVYTCQTGNFTLSAGQLIFLPATLSYTMRCDSVEPFVHFTVNFRLSSLRAQKLHLILEIASGARRQLNDIPSGSRCYELFEKLLSVWQRKSNGYQVLAKALLYELLYLYFTDAGHASYDADRYARLHPAKKALDDPHAADYSVGMLAALCSLSETHFRRMFHAAFGMTPTEYRNEKRILRAKDLLMSGQYSITEVSREVGFSDPSYFARVFRRYTGLSPRDYLSG